MSDEERQVVDQKTIERLHSEIARMEEKFVRVDVLNARLDRINDGITGLEKRMLELVGERTWLLRLVLGANILAVIGLVLNKQGAL
jgi:hypothetical protein